MSGHANPSFELLRHHVRAAVACFLAVVIVCGLGSAQADQPLSTDENAITVTADLSRTWATDEANVAILRGHCRIVQGDARLESRQMVIWQLQRSSRHRLIAYLEEDVRVETPTTTFSQASLLVDLVTTAGITIETRHTLNGQGDNGDVLFARAEKRRNASRRGTLQQTQLTVSGQSAEQPELQSVQIHEPAGAMRRIRVFPRSSQKYYVETFPSENTTPPEQILVLMGGINLLVEGVEHFGTVDLAADRMVIWTRQVSAEDLGQGAVQTRDTPFQVYLEGNIVVRQGENIIRSSRAFYDAREDRALLLDADLKAYLSELKGNLRVRASRIRQLSQNSFHAQNAWASMSPFGKPGYRLQASDIYLDQRQWQSWNGSRQYDPVTGAPILEEVPWITTLNNAFLVDDFPLFYTPYLSGPADDPNVPLKNASVKQDSVFGVQLETEWDLMKVLGLESSVDVDWGLHADYRSLRGPGVGTSFDYRGQNLLNLFGAASGESLLYYQYDHGDDNLGSDRRDLAPDSSNRGRALWRHRSDFFGNTSLLAEVGYLSDRNYLEQYYETEFDEKKDNETLVYLKQSQDNWMWSLRVQPRLNDFENSTEWYPRGDINLLTQPIFGGLLTWSTHTSAGYANLQPADAPGDPVADRFVRLPYMTDSSGAVLMSRHEVDAPFNIGALKLVPYAVGEAAFWGEGQRQSDIERYVGSAGVRGSLMLWRVFPYVWSRVFNLNGLAHKMVFDVDYSFTDASRDLDEIAQYNPFDDNAQERFRQRLIFNTFGTMDPLGLPPTFEPRFYAVRTGAGLPVTAPYHELVDDMHVLRLAWRHRLQTKVGPPERLRIKDWMTLDLEASYFPNADRDNFGEEFGLLGARYRWLVGERTHLLANAYYDLFDDAQQLWDVGILSQRSLRGSFYTGIRQVKGAGLNSQIVTASCSYRMSPKWVSTIGTAYDIGESENRGQSLTITRIGNDFILHFGASYDASKGNAGFAFMIEPRFGPLDESSMQLSSLLGITR